jgi:hypothetical protein
MKKFAVAMLMAVALVLGGCGSDHSNNINGNWTATLTDNNAGDPVFNFATSLVVNGDGTLRITNFSFSSNSSCFSTGETESGSFALSGDFNGNVSGKFQFTVQSDAPDNNSLQLTGMVNGNTISGTWTAVGGTGCNASGTFTMTKS